MSEDMKVPKFNGAGFSLWKKRMLAAFKSRGLTNVIDSSTEAKAKVQDTQDAQAMMLLDELGIKFNKPRLFVDNASAEALIKSIDTKRRSKHIETKYHFVREQFKRGLFDVQHVPSRGQKADYLTKRLSAELLAEQRKLTGIISRRETKLDE